MPNDPANNPFAPATRDAANAGNFGLVSVEQQRAIAEVQAALIIARAHKRVPHEAMELILADCGRPSLADDATYEYSRGGTSITGPSIRLAETIARRWGNIECGVRELSRREGFSECLAYAWDMETNFRDHKTFQVRHWRDKKNGQGYVVTDERDIYEIVANQGARRKRACILAIIPPDVVEGALAECEKTLKQRIKVTDELIAEMLEKFEEFGVTKEMIEKRIQKHISAITPGQAIQMRRIYTSLKDGMSSPAEWFEMPDAAAGGKPAGSASGVAGAKAAMAKKDGAGAAAGETTEPAATASTDAGAAAAGAADKTGDEKKDPPKAVTAPDMVAQVKSLCERAVAAGDNEAARLLLDDARSIAGSLKGGNKSNADLAISQASEELDKKFPKAK